MARSPLLTVENLRVTFPSQAGAVEAVKDLSFQVMPGEVLAIVGESGSGKSVTALAILQLLGFEGAQIDRGRILFDQGEKGIIDLNQCTTRQMQDLRGTALGMIFQEPATALNPVLTIGHQLMEGLRKHHGLSRSKTRAKALELLQETRISNPEKRLLQYPHELSGGMRQRVMIAMALACKPRLLIADEPTTALDVTTQAEILSLINRLRQGTEMTVIFITHDMGVVAQLADRAVVLKDGEKVEEADVNTLFSAPTHPYTKALLASVPRLATAGQISPKKPPDQPPLLRVENLSLRFPVQAGLLRRTQGYVHAVSDVSFTLGAGKTLALVGESGSGKTTVGRAILRLMPPNSGRVTLDGQCLTSLSSRDLHRTRSQMQMIFQDPYGSLNPVLRLGEQVAEPLRNFTPLDAVARQERVAHLFDRVGLDRGLMQRYPHALSGGQRQRVAIARALALNPRLIIADEAVSALDVSVQKKILDLLLELQADLGLSYLFISHDMAVVNQISHHIAVMQGGRIVEYGPRDAVLGRPRHDYTRALLSAVPAPDPGQRLFENRLKSAVIQSPIYPPAHRPAPSVYDDLGDGHTVLRADPPTC